MSQVGARIRFIRLEIGWSVRKLAQQAKCSAAAIMRIELGRSAISRKLLHNIACGLHVRPFELLNFDTDDNGLGYVIARMRQDPEIRANVIAQIEAWDLFAAMHDKKSACFVMAMPGFPVCSFMANELSA